MHNKLNTIKQFKNLLFICGIFLFILTGCNPTKYVKPNELFLQKSKVKIDSRKIDKDEIESIVKQKPNKKILGLFRFHLGVYNSYKEDSESKIKLNIGEAPVIYDSLLTESSLKQLKIYTKNRGYFDSEISYSTKIKNNKIKIEYQINLGEPYLIKSIDYVFADDEIKKKSFLILRKTLLDLKPGNTFDIDVLDKQREKIKVEMKNLGYYYFNKDFIKYKADSTGGKKEIAIFLHINNQKIKDKLNDTIIEKPHIKYNVNDVNIYLSKNYKDKNLNNFDTITFKNVKVHMDTSNGERLKYRPRMLNHAVGLKKGELYRLENQQSTYRHFNELGLFKNVNVSFDDIGENRLNTNIFLIPSKKKAFSIEGIGTNSGGDLGVKGNLIYQNRNLFRGGENLTVKLSGGLEIQQLINADEDQNNVNFLGIFNTLEFGPDLNLEFPRFLLPISLERFSRKMNPKTNLRYLLNYQKRPEYVRNLTQVSFGYFWNGSRFIKHYVNPIDVSIIKLAPTADFQAKLDDENTNPFILNSFKDHFINASNYSFIYNSQRINKVTNFEFFKFNLEVAGNIQSGFYSLTNKPYDNPETESYNLFNIRYAQYVKTDFDFRAYGQTKSTSFVKRINLGIGKPYGNLDVLPFEKSYFGGGANSIRAWQARSLGPGSILLDPDSSVFQIGELKIEGNLEYRFDITKLFEGAAFVDAGNIWILSKDENRPNAEIDINKFWKDIAVGVGVGLRLDFNFFLIRLDLAAKLKDPGSETPEKFDLIWRQPTLNLGIGYPF